MAENRQVVTEEQIRAAVVKAAQPTPVATPATSQPPPTSPGPIAPQATAAPGIDPLTNLPKGWLAPSGPKWDAYAKSQGDLVSLVPNPREMYPKVDHPTPANPGFGPPIRKPGLNPNNPTICFLSNLYSSGTAFGFYFPDKSHTEL